MTQNSRHVAPTLDNRWSVRKSGASRASRIFDKKAEAIAYAKIQALREHTDLYIHGKDGMVTEKPDLRINLRLVPYHIKESSGQYSCPPKAKKQK